MRPTTGLMAGIRTCACPPHACACWASIQATIAPYTYTPILLPRNGVTGYEPPLYPTHTPRLVQKASARQQSASRPRGARFRQPKRAADSHHSNNAQTVPLRAAAQKRPSDSAAPSSGPAGAQMCRRMLRAHAAPWQNRHCYARPAHVRGAAPAYPIKRMAGINLAAQQQASVQREAATPRARAAMSEHSPGRQGDQASTADRHAGRPPRRKRAAPGARRPCPRRCSTARGLLGALRRGVSERDAAERRGRGRGRARQPRGNVGKHLRHIAIGLCARLPEEQPILLRVCLQAFSELWGVASPDARQPCGTAKQGGPFTAHHSPHSADQGAGQALGERRPLNSPAETAGTAVTAQGRQRDHQAR